jgi:integral membrane protein (TIGR01906 family)
VGPGAHARRIGGAWLLGASTAIVILGASIAPFLAPPVVRFEQDRTNVSVLTGLPPAELDRVTGSLLADLVLWQGDFAVRPPLPPRSGPQTLLNDAERSHMRDVRGVFTGFWVLVALGLLGLVIGARRSATDPLARAATWRAVAGGARALAVLIAVAGVFAVVAFDAAFELFHRLLFSGNYNFDPATEKLVQLFPEQFWSEIAIAVGVVVIAAALVVSVVAGRRAATLASAAAA